MGKVKRKIAKFLWKIMIPDMISGFKRNDGVTLKRTRIGSTTTLVYPEKLMIEDNVFVGQYNFIEASQGISIGEGCQITNFVSITSHSSHKSIRLYGANYNSIPDMKGYVKGSISIGRYSFIGPHTVIMPGTIIGKGSIVSAGTIAKGSYPDFSIIGGNPGVVIGDTREMDKEYLDQNPELKINYDAWSKE